MNDITRLQELVTGAPGSDDQEISPDGKSTFSIGC
jgi:hypothetical protein